MPNECENQIIFWDNIFANDYCPRKLLIGPWKYRKNLNSIMVNPTGLIETDLFILDLIFLTKIYPSNRNIWIKACKKNVIPNQFFFIEKFCDPYVNKINNLNINKKDYQKIIKAFDELLWGWNTPLSREWYIYLFC